MSIINAGPLRLRVKAQRKLEKDSDLMIDQIRAIVNMRLTKGPLTQLDKKYMASVHEAIFEVLGGIKKQNS